MPGKCSATKLHTHPRHRRERQFPGPAAKYGPRILLQSGGEVGSHYCSHPLLPSLQGPSSLRAGASQGPLPRGRLPASLMNFSLLSRVQSFLQVLTATLIFSPFCKGSICSRTLPHLEGVPFPNPQHDRCGTGYHPREGRWCSLSMAPHPCLPHTLFFFISIQALLLFPFLLSHSVLELERASETRKLSPCVQMRIHSHIICPRPAGI